MKIINRCALCGDPFKEVSVNGLTLPEVWHGEDGFDYCCEDHAYLTITALFAHFRKEGVKLS